MRTKAWWGDVPVSQLYGENAEWYLQNVGQPGHNGVDFAFPLWYEVVAHSPLTVKESGYDPGGWGYYVKLGDASGGEWIYAHLQKEGRPPEGAPLDSGWTVGFTGSSGLSSGPHLHLGYRPDASYRASALHGWVDPLPYLPREWSVP